MPDPALRLRAAALPRASEETSRSLSPLATYPCRTRRKSLWPDVRQRLAVIGGGLREHLSAVVKDIAQNVERLDSDELPPNYVVVLVLVGGFLLPAQLNRSTMSGGRLVRLKNEERPFVVLDPFADEHDELDHRAEPHRQIMTAVAFAWRGPSW